MSEEEGQLDETQCEKKFNGSTSDNNIEIYETPASISDKSHTKNNLIVNFIPQSVDEHQLFNLFQPYGHINSLKIVKDLSKCSHKGYGFVKYSNEFEAQNAINVLNGFAIGNKFLKVSYALPRNMIDSNTNLYISGFPQTFGDSDLRKLFSPYGKLIECRVILGMNGESRRIGFVRYSTTKNAKRALESLNGHIFSSDSSLFIKFASNRKKEVQSSASLHDSSSRIRKNEENIDFSSNSNINNNLNGSANVSSNSMSNNGSIIGQPGSVSSSFMSEFSYDRALQMAFLEHIRSFKFPLIGNNIVQNHHQQNLMQSYQLQSQHRPYNYNSYINCCSNQSNTCVFVFHLPTEATENEIRELFSQCGHIESVKIYFDPETRKPKGFGFINYSTHEEAEKAIRELNGTQMRNKFLKLSFKL